MFRDRRDAGRQLSARLLHLRGVDVVVLGLPRGGVPVAAEVAGALGAPLDVVLVRKLGVPWQPELAMGAIGEGGVRVVDDRVVAMTGVTATDVERAEARERAVLAARTADYRGDAPPVDLRDRTAVVVDDGIATGSTARAACAVVRAAGAARVVVAVPVAPPGWTDAFDAVADGCVAVATPRQFDAVGRFYDDFSATTDAEVLALLAPGGGE